MKAKEYVIQKLVQAGKKHSWMKYPTLAAVSLLSFFFLIIEKCMERPKRAVIALVCCVLIVTQAWYLISLASDSNSGEPADADMPGDYTDIAPTIEIADEPDMDEPEIQCTISYDVNGMGVAKDADVITGDAGWEALGDAGFVLTAPTISSTNADYYRFKCWTTKKNDVSTAITNVTKDYFYEDGELRTNFLKLYAYWERSAYKVTYAPGSGTSTGSDQYEERAVIGADGKATITLQNRPEFVKEGYTYKQWRINDSSTNLVSIGETYEFGDSDITVYPHWRANPYYIAFESGDPAATGSMDTIEAYYEEAQRLPVNKFKKTGYVFNGWKGPDGTIYTDAQEVKNLSNVSGTTVTLTATWKYTTAHFSKATLNYRYGDKLTDEILKIYHNEEGDGNFSPVLVAANGETKNGKVTLDTLTEMTGISVDPQTNQILLTAERIQTVGTVELTFSIHDNNHPDEKDISLSLTLNLGKRALTVTGVDNLSKVYDGTCDIPIGSIHFTGADEGAQITVNNASQKGIFEDADVGTDKTITIEGIFVKGADADYYDIDDNAVVTGGSITPRTVHVTTKPTYPDGQDYILAGQTPVFMVEVDESDLPEATANTDKLLIKTVVAGHYVCEYGAPDYLPGESYRIGIDTQNEELLSTLKNYKLEVTEGILVVRQGAPLYLDDYFISGNRLDNSKWYYLSEPMVQATADSDYDTVYLTNDSLAAAKTYEPGLFKTSATVSEEMCSANQKLYIQLANSRTGAVTSMQEVEIYVDITAPEVDTDNIRVESVNTSGLSKFGNFLSFGNFFRESLKITVPVTDALSGTDKLIYYLDGDTVGKEVAIVNGEASLNVNAKYTGEIALKSSDLAGNVSNKADIIGVGGSTYWVVENEAPDLSVTAKDAEGNNVYQGENYYYKSVNLTVDVQDMDAGVAYIEWTISRNGNVIEDAVKEEVTNKSQLVEQTSFTRTITDSGKYEITIRAYDNADNYTDLTEPVTFIVDGTAPLIQVTPENYDQSWAAKKTITFTVTDLESGVDMLSVRNTEGNYPYIIVEGQEDTYTFDVTKKGTYTIKAVDKAGNKNEVTLTFEKVSAEIPEDPTVTVDPLLAEGQKWYTVNPTITITEPDTTPDGTNINVYYHLWQEGTEEPYQYERVTDSFQLPSEGIWNIRIWAETESGVKSTGEGLYQICYDETAPVITDIRSGGNGNTSVISFKVQEAVSGLESLKVVYNDTDTKLLSFEKEADGTYSASFTAALKGSYVIYAVDQVGNSSTADAFVPMKIVVTGVSGNAADGIVISGKVYTGTFEVSGVSLAYASADAEKGNQKPKDFVVTTDADGNKAFTAKLTKLSEGTRYLFAVTALAKSGQKCEYTGTFQTAETVKSGISIAGTVVDETLDATDKTPITVALYNGNDIVQSKNVKNGDNFMFKNVENGSYTIRAVNENRSASEGLVIENRTVIEPVSEIELILRDGRATSVEYADANTPRVSVSGLENIFDDTTNFGSPADLSIIEAGGSVEFCMKVDGLSEEEVSESDMVALNRKMKKIEKAGMYLDLSIWKITSGAYGIISETQVTSISGGKNIRVVIPLSSELAAHDNLSVIRIHGTTAERLADLDTNPNTYTIESALFSTYAVVYSDNSTTADTSTDATTATDDNTAASSTEASTGSQTDADATTRDISMNQKTTISLQSGANGSPQTGDMTPIIWIVMLGLSAVVCGIGFIKKKQP